MALKKYSALFGNNNTASKKVDSTIQDKDNSRTKQEIEQLKNIINKKLKSPEMAKKAAEILQNWGLRD